VYVKMWGYDEELYEGAWPEGDPPRMFEPAEPELPFLLSVLPAPETRHALRVRHSTWFTPLCRSASECAPALPDGTPVRTPCPQFVAHARQQRCAGATVPVPQLPETSQPPARTPC
jgi:hypothetical protein